jgi:hypothetical protein
MNENPLQIPDFSGDDFSDDKEILRARQEAAAYKQMLNDSLDILKRSLNLYDSSHKNFKVFHMFKSLKATIVDSYISSNFPTKLLVSVAEYLSSYPTARNANTGIEKYIFGFIELRKDYPSTYISRKLFNKRSLICS